VAVSGGAVAVGVAVFQVPVGVDDTVGDGVAVEVWVGVFTTWGYRSTESKYNDPAHNAGSMWIPMDITAVKSGVQAAV
jgi:hypothetical protein